jgi:hypothetical protein
MTYVSALGYHSMLFKAEGELPCATAKHTNTEEGTGIITLIPLHIQRFSKEKPNRQHVDKGHIQARSQV